jgi:sugar-specific transcriptional regulator TrmB
LLVEEEAQQLFAKLGLTNLQAKVYLTILYSGEATAKSISAAAKIDRPDVYRVIATLTQKGFIEKKIDKPIRFTASPINEVLEVLLKRQQEDVEESKKRATEILRGLSYKKTWNNELGTFYNLLPGNKAVIDKTAGKIISSSQKSIDFVSINLYPPIIGFKPLEDFLLRGGRDRMLSYNKNATIAQKIIKSFKKGNIEIRYVSEPPIVVALIGDRKQVMLITTRGKTKEESECLFTNSPVVAELTSIYFENLWRGSEK